VPDVRRQRRPAPASCAGLQSRQFLAHAGDARADQRLVADEPEGEADQDRCEGGEPRSLRRISDGRGRHGRSHHQRQREALDCHAFTSNRREECAQMPRKMARSAPDHRSGCPMRWWPSSPRGCLAGRPEIREYSRQIGSHLGNPGVTQSAWLPSSAPETRVRGGRRAGEKNKRESFAFDGARILRSARIRMAIEIAIERWYLRRRNSGT
jgi:hypothetical protein